jgi:CheY-like chemotaxis protein
LPAREAGQSPPSFVGQKPVLVADDDDISQSVLIRQLQSLGLNALQAETGLDALKQITANPEACCLIFMDINMPEMDGLTATRRIREQETGTARHIPIIALTANAIVGDREIYLAAGMDDYLSKPVHLNELQAMLERWL